MRRGMTMGDDGPSASDLILLSFDLFSRPVPFFPFFLGRCDVIIIDPLFLSTKR